MIQLIRTDSNNNDFIQLVKHLDAELAIIDGDDHAFYAEFNKTAKLKHTVVAYDNNTAVGIGALRELSPGIIEIKRMYTLPQSRGKGIAAAILKELEIWATELSYKKAVLETGRKQPAAISLYKKSGYAIIPNYGQYHGMYESVCFEKEMKQ